MKVILAGQLNHDNMGDALMALIYAKTLLAEGHEVFLCEASDIMSKRLAAEDLSLPNVNRSFNKADIDLCVFIGGGYFGEPDITWLRWQMNFMRRKYFQDISSNCILKGIPYVIGGVEIGPLTGPIIRRVIKQILINAQYIVARNEESKAFAEKKLGVKPKKISDIVLGNIPAGLSEGNCQEKYEIGIHLTQKLLKKNIFSFRIWNALKDWIRDRGIERVVFIRDQELPDEMKQRVADLKKHIVNIRKDIVCDFFDFKSISHLLRIISMIQILVTTKLHCGIAAYGYSNHAICIGSHPKIARFYRDIKKEENFINYYFFSKRKFTKARKRINGLANSNDEILRQRKKESINNLIQLREYMDKIGRKPTT